LLAGQKKRFTEVEAALSATPGNSTDSDDGGFSENKHTEDEEDLDKLDFDGQNCIDISFTFKGITPSNKVIKEQR
jgi:hypothetical protein